MVVIARETGNPDDIELLADYRADVTAVSVLGQPALHFAARNSHAEVLDLMLDLKFDVECKYLDVALYPGQSRSS